jgi:hypothetical protein
MRPALSCAAPIPVTALLKHDGAPTSEEGPRSSDLWCRAASRSARAESAARSASSASWLWMTPAPASAQHRTPATNPSELRARRWEDHRDADLSDRSRTHQSLDPLAVHRSASTRSSCGPARSRRLSCWRSPSTSVRCCLPATRSGQLRGTARPTCAPSCQRCRSRGRSTSGSSAGRGVAQARTSVAP